MFDSMEKLEEKVSLLHEMVLAAQHVVVHTGAGVSTAAGRAVMLTIALMHISQFLSQLSKPLPQA